MRALALLLPMIVVTSGCTSSSGGLKETQPADPGSTIVVDDGRGGTIAVQVTNGTGVLVGEVLNDAGFGLSGARVTVWGAPNGSTTNETGWFEVKEVPPGNRLVRAEHPNYRPAESEIRVEAGRAQRLTITLVGASSSAGELPHAHDYWAGRERVLVTDTDFEFHKPRSGLSSAWAPTATKLAQLAQASCVSGAGVKSGYVSTFWFDDAAQIVWPRTAAIEVTVTWTPSDFVGGSNVGIVYRAANMSAYAWSNAIRSGQTLRLPVEPAMWDNGHQPFTLWDFGLCVGGKDEASQTGTAGRSFIGRYHVRMELVAGHAITLDPPHPRFWANSSKIQVLDGTRTFSCVATADLCFATAYQGRAIFGERFFVWKPTTIVPPGTAFVHVYLNWTYSLPTGKPLGLSFSDASRPSRDKEDESGYEPLKATASTSSTRLFVLAPEPGSTDSFYQKRTNWAFLWGNEGEESSASYLLTCGCELKVSVTAYAIGPSAEDLA